ncbi:MAG TPA: DUF1800 domain-containing protein [Puia sp.]|nr:DUF1800 domain-containing protein [Puia sp.]
MRDQRKNQHLLWRAGFGPSADQFKQIRNQSSGKLFRSMLEACQKAPVLFDVADSGLKAMVMAARNNPFPQRRNFSPEEKKDLRKQSVQDIKTLNVRWLQEMTDTDAQLREKMSLFWHGHFASKTANIFYDQELLNIIRQHALGNFRDLLFSVSKSASMIQFLNNNQNRKDHPNENFARELMELFTLGRGNYTEQDVKESARAFTGWGTRLAGGFEFRERQHDPGGKIFLGRTGNFSGDDILEILLGEKQTAIFITRKIYRFFVNDQADENRVSELATAFYDNGYDIQKLMESIFSSDWFYDDINIGAHIKSPVEWIVGIRRQLPQDIGNPEVQVLLQRLLGQVLFNPPNVAGWPGGKHWIDSSSLMLRLRFPQIMYSADTILATPKDDDDLMMGLLEESARRRREMNRAGQIIHTRIHWETCTDQFRESKEEYLIPDIRQWLLQCGTAINNDSLKSFLNLSGRDSLIQSAIIRIMSTPEYQLC